MFPSQKRREVRAQRKEQWLWGSWDPAEVSCSTADRGRHSHHWEEAGALQSPLREAVPCGATSAAQAHPPLLLFIPPFQPAALQKQPTAAWFGVDQTQVAPSHTEVEETRNDNSSRAPWGSPAPRTSASRCASSHRWCPTPWAALGAASEECDLKFLFSQRGLVVAGGQAWVEELHFQESGTQVD